MEGNIKVECMLLGRKVLDTYHFNKLLSLAHRGGGVEKEFSVVMLCILKLNSKGLQGQEIHHLGIVSIRVNIINCIVFIFRVLTVVTPGF